MKIAVMGTSGLLGIVTGRLVIESFGTAAYAQYGLLSGFPALLPFADLGIAAVVVNAVAGSSDVRTDPEVRRAVTTALRLLSLSGAVIVLAAAVVSLLGAWPVLLGNGLLDGVGPVAAFACLALFGLLLPLSVVPRMLVGLRRSTSLVAAQGIVAPFILAGVTLLVLSGLPAGGYLSVLSYLAAGSVSLICLLAVSRASAPLLSRAFRDLPRLAGVRSVPVLTLALPTLVQTIVLAVAFQSDRLLLSHLTTGDELAMYNLAAQLFGLVLQTIIAAGITLWPVYAAARAAGRVESPFLPSLWFTGGGLVLAALLAGASPWLADLVSGGRLALDPWLVGGFVAFATLEAAKYPLGMYMTDARGLRFQVAPTIAMLVMNVSLSVWLIGVVGAGGPVIASAISVAVCQVAPNALFVRADLRRRLREARAAASAGSPGGPTAE